MTIWTMLTMMDFLKVVKMIRAAVGRSIVKMPPNLTIIWCQYWSKVPKQTPASKLSRPKTCNKGKYSWIIMSSKVVWQVATARAKSTWRASRSLTKSRRNLRLPSWMAASYSRLSRVASRVTSSSSSSKSSKLSTARISPKTRPCCRSRVESWGMRTRMWCLCYSKF